MIRGKPVTLALLALCAFADGVAHQLTAPGEMFAQSDFVFTVIATLLVFIWYRFDSDERQYPRTPWLNVAMIAIVILALPYYFYRSRGFRKGSIAVGLMLAFVVAYGVIQRGGELVAYYVRQT